MYQPLDGPSAQIALTVTNSAVVEAKAGASTFTDRKAITIQPVNGDIYVYFGDDTGTTPSAATIQANGLIVYKSAKDSYEASNKQKIYLLGVTTSVRTIIVERS